MVWLSLGPPLHWGSYTCYPPKSGHLLPLLCRLLAWQRDTSGRPSLRQGSYQLYRSSLVIITQLCLRNINHPLAVSQVYVRDNKVLPPLTPLSCLDCKTQLYGETHKSLPNRFPQQPRQSRQAPRSPSLGGPTLLAASAPSDLARWPPSPPVWTCCLGGADVTNPARGSCRPPQVPSTDYPHQLCTGPASSPLAPLQLWLRARLGEDTAWPSGECPSRATWPTHDKYHLHSCSLARRARPKSQVPKLGRQRTEKTRWKLDDNLGRGYKSLRSYSKKKSHPVP